MKKRQGISYRKRVYEVNRIYDTYARSGLSNREIWRRYIYPRFGICERTFYNMLTAGTQPDKQLGAHHQLTLHFYEEPYTSPFQAYSK